MVGDGQEEEEEEEEEKDEPIMESAALTPDLVKVLRLQEAVLLSQVSALHRLSERHLITSNGTDPLTGNHRDLPAHLRIQAARRAAKRVTKVDMVRPNQLEIKFVHLLDEAGGLASKNSVVEATKLMEIAGMSRDSTLIRAIMLTALRRTFKDKVRNCFGEYGVFKVSATAATRRSTAAVSCTPQVLSRWLADFVEKNDEESLVLCLNTLLDLPVLDSGIRESGIGKLIRKIKKEQTGDASELASKVVTHWQTVSRGRKLCGIPEPSEQQQQQQSRTASLARRVPVMLYDRVVCVPQRETATID
jgi:hypothetical protein